jgi:hypothetical protein
MGETSGTVAVDEMGYANGTYKNTPLLNQTGLVNDGNASVDFLGTEYGPYISLPYIQSGTQASMVWFFNLRTKPSIVYFISNASPGAYNTRLRVELNGRIVVYIANGSSQASVTGNFYYQQDYIPNSTEMIGVTIDGTTVKIYRNNNLDKVGTSSIGLTSAPGTGLYFGAHLSTRFYHPNGRCDELSIFDKVLSDSEMAMIWQTAGL